MSISAVFHQDLLDIRRSKLVWVNLIVCPLLTAGSFFGYTLLSPVGARKAIFSISGMLLPVLIFVPIVALIGSSLSIAGERESGTIRFLLGLPNDRTEIVFGKFLSRAFLINGCLSIGFVLSALLAIIQFDQPRLVELGSATLLTMLLATAYVALAVGLSAVTASQIRAITAAIASYLVWAFFWIPPVPSSIPTLVEKHTDVTVPTLAHIEIVSPSMAFVHSSQLLGSIPRRLMMTIASGPKPVSPVIAIGSLVAWIIVPLVIGYWWFGKIEVN